MNLFHFCLSIYSLYIQACAIQGVSPSIQRLINVILSKAFKGGGLLSLRCSLFYKIYNQMNCKTFCIAFNEFSYMYKFCTNSLEEKLARRAEGENTAAQAHHLRPMCGQESLISSELLLFFLQRLFFCLCLDPHSRTYFSSSSYFYSP